MAGLLYYTALFLSSELPSPHVHSHTNTNILCNLWQKHWETLTALWRTLQDHRWDPAPLKLPLKNCPGSSSSSSPRSRQGPDEVSLRVSFWGKTERVCSGCPNTKILEGHSSLNSCKQQYHITKEVYINDTTRTGKWCIVLKMFCSYLHF